MKTNILYRNNQARLIGTVTLLFLIWANSAFALTTGDRVSANATINVRSTAAGLIAGTQTSGSLGTIIGGATTAILSSISYTWWNVKFDYRTNGWVASIGIVLVAAQYADLAPQTLSLTPTSGLAGASVQVSFKVTNSGAGASVAT